MPAFLLTVVADIQGLPKKNGDPIARQIAANRGKSRQIAANRGKIRQISFKKKWRSLFKKIATDRIAEGIPENNGDHFGGEI